MVTLRVKSLVEDGRRFPNRLSLRAELCVWCPARLCPAVGHLRDHGICLLRAVGGYSGDLGQAGCDRGRWWTKEVCFGMIPLAVVGRMVLSEAECCADSSQGMRQVPVVMVPGLHACRNQWIHLV